MTTDLKPAIKDSKTVIISGFPGIGKSKCTSLYQDGYNGDHIMDSDSSTFPKNNFPQNYIEHIYYALNVRQPDILFVSSHEEVRAELVNHRWRFILAFPELKLRGEYIQRYTNRESPEAFLKLCFDKWSEWINSCQAQKGCDKWELGAGEYLSDRLAIHIPLITQTPQL